MKRIAGLVKSFVSGRSSIGAVLQTSASNILIQAAYVGSGVITARTLGQAEEGLSLPSSCGPQFLSYALTLGIPISSVYHIRRDPKHGSSLTAAAILISVTMGFVASLVGFAVIPHSLHTYAPSTIRFARWAVLISPLAHTRRNAFNAGPICWSFQTIQLSFALPNLLPSSWCSSWPGRLAGSQPTQPLWLTFSPVFRSPSGILFGSGGISILDLKVEQNLFALC